MSALATVMYSLAGVGVGVVVFFILVCVLSKTDGNGWLGAWKDLRDVIVAVYGGRR